MASHVRRWCDDWNGSKRKIRIRIVLRDTNVRTNLRAQHTHPTYDAMTFEQNENADVSIVVFYFIDTFDMRKQSLKSISAKLWDHIYTASSTCLSPTHSSASPVSFARRILSLRFHSPSSIRSTRQNIQKMCNFQLLQLVSPLGSAKCVFAFFFVFAGTKEYSASGGHG